MTRSLCGCDVKQVLELLLLTCLIGLLICIRIRRWMRPYRNSSEVCGPVVSRWFPASRSPAQKMKLCVLRFPNNMACVDMLLLGAVAVIITVAGLGLLSLPVLVSSDLKAVSTLLATCTGLLLGLCVVWWCVG